MLEACFSREAPCQQTSSCRVIRFHVPVLVWGSWWPEDDFQHPDKKAVTADHADRDNGPYENRENEKCEEFLATANGQNRGSERSERPRNHGHLPIIDYSAGRYNSD